MIRSGNIVDDLRTRGWAKIIGCLEEAAVAEALMRWAHFFSECDKPARASAASLEGYFQFGSERAVGSKIPDRKEFFQFHDPAIVPPSLRTITARLFSQACEIAQGIADQLHTEGLLPFQPEYREPGGHAMRIIHYQGVAGTAAFPHTDITLFTLGLCETGRGLWIEERSGGVVAPAIPPGGVIAVAGDMLEAASAARVRACRHWVEATSERHAIVFFANPSNAALLREGLSAGEALARRLAEMTA